MFFHHRRRPQCFTDEIELGAAIRAYTASQASNKSRVAQIYGWPIGNWCFHNDDSNNHPLTSFAYLFAGTQDFDYDLSGWNK